MEPCRILFSATTLRIGTLRTRTLWFAIVCEELVAQESGAKPSLYATRVDDTGRTIRDVLVSIATNYMRGTPNGIHMDSESALIWSPSHFTWMDTNYPAATPREGYPVEIQALWIRLLRQLARISEGADRTKWNQLADRALFPWKKFSGSKTKVGTPTFLWAAAIQRLRAPPPAMPCAAIVCFS